MIVYNADLYCVSADKSLAAIDVSNGAVVAHKQAAHEYDKFHFTSHVQIVD